MKRIAINGFGRIGRLAFRLLEERNDVEVVAINNTYIDLPALANLLKYDSAHGRFAGTVEVDGDNFIVNGRAINVLGQKNPDELPWSELNVDVVIESTGKFTHSDAAALHLKSGAKKVVISAPGKGGVKTVVLGVNDEVLSDEDTIVSNASCTTNCLAPMAKVLNDSFGIKSGFITTIHAYTADQRLQDSSHRDLRRSRAAAVNMIPTTTGAAAAVGLVLPDLAGKLDGLAVRVPTVTGSVTDLTVVLDKETTKEEVNAAMKAASEGSMSGVLAYCTDPIVSSDIVGDPHSCIFDSDLTKVSGNVVKVFGWYDNEAGYATRVADLVERI